MNILFFSNSKVSILSSSGSKVWPGGIFASSINFNCLSRSSSHCFFLSVKLKKKKLAHDITFQKVVKDRFTWHTTIFINLLKWYS